MKNIFVLSVLILAAACDSKEKEETPRLALSVNDEIHFTQYAPEEENVTVKVETNQPSWSVTSDQDWCKIERQNAGFIVSAIPNVKTSEPPKATITVKAGKALSQTLFATQDAALQYISVTPQSGTVPSSGGQINVAVASNTDWQISSDKSWVSFKKDSGTGDENILLTVAKNNTTVRDKATVTFLTETQNVPLTITRLAAAASVSVSPETATVPATGGVVNVSVISNTSWQVSSDKNWVSVNQTAGSGNENIILTVAENNSEIQDYATITFTTATQNVALKITRLAASKTISISPQAQTVSSAGGVINVSVTSNTSWQVSSNKNWVSIHKTSGNGNDNVPVTIAANSTTHQDYATVTFRTETKSVTLNVTRQAAQAMISISPQSQTVSAAGGTFTALILSNMSWQVSSSQEWAKVSAVSGTGNKNLTVTISPNKSRYQDYATITVFNGTKSITLSITRQAGPIYSIGDYYPDPDSPSNALGIVFSIDNPVNGAGYHGKILSANAVKGQFWYNKIYGFPWVLVGATSKTNGKFNVEAVRKSNGGNTTGYAAFAYCKRKTDGGLEWYLPAIDELRTMYALRHIISPKISLLGGIDIREDHISSTEYSANSMYYMNRKGAAWTDLKTVSSFYTRPVATF